MRAFRIQLLLTALAFALPGVAAAQSGQIGSYSRPKTNNYPAFSPYLNLNRPGNTATNYFGMVRPQMETNRQFEQIEQGMGLDPRFPGGMSNDGSIGGPGGGRYYPDQARGLQTGHPATYFYYSHYYNFQQGQRPGAGGSGAGNNSNFGRQATQPLQLFTGNNGVIMPVNPAGANPLGGDPFGGIQPLTPGLNVMP